MEHLGFFQFVEVADGLQFHDDVLIAEEVCIVGLAQTDVAIVNCDGFLAFVGDLGVPELHFEGILVDFFQEAAAQGFVNPERGADDGEGLVVLKRRHGVVPFGCAVWQKKIWRSCGR